MAHEAVSCTQPLRDVAERIDLAFGEDRDALYTRVHSAGLADPDARWEGSHTDFTQGLDPTKIHQPLWRFLTKDEGKRPPHVVPWALTGPILGMEGHVAFPPIGGTLRWAEKVQPKPSAGPDAQTNEPARERGKNKGKTDNPPVSVQRLTSLVVASTAFISDRHLENIGVLGPVDEASRGRGRYRSLQVALAPIELPGVEISQEGGNSYLSHGPKNLHYLQTEFPLRLAEQLITVAKGNPEGIVIPGTVEAIRYTRSTERFLYTR